MAWCWLFQHLHAVPQRYPGARNLLCIYRGWLWHFLSPPWSKRGWEGMGWEKKEKHSSCWFLHFLCSPETVRYLDIRFRREVDMAEGAVFCNFVVNSFPCKAGVRGVSFRLFFHFGRFLFLSPPPRPAEPFMGVWVEWIFILAEGDTAPWTNHTLWGLSGHPWV